jgi:hypothetical protein
MSPDRSGLRPTSTDPTGVDPTDFDEERYTREVLEPARLADGQPPTDLTVRYGLASPLSGAQVAATLPRVLGCWRRARRELKYRRLVTRLEADHARLAGAFGRAVAGDLRPLLTAIEEAQSANRERAGRLRAEIADLAVPLGRITPELAAELAARYGVSPGELTVLLARSGVRVAPADPIPGRAPVSGYPRYRNALRTLGCRHTADFLLDPGGGAAAPDPVTVWDGVAVAGRPETRVGPQTVLVVDRTWAARPHDGARTLASTVLVALKSLVESPGPAGIAELVRFEIAEELRTRHRQGASAAALVEYASGLGLAREDARRIAFAVRAEPYVPPAPGRHAAPETSAAASEAPTEDPAESSAGSTATGAADVLPDLGPALPGEAGQSTAAPAPDAATRVPDTPVPASGRRPGPISTTPPRAGQSPGDTSTSPPTPRPAATPTAEPVAGSRHPAVIERRPSPAPGHITVDRLGDEVVVRWQWPPDISEVLLRWHAPHAGEVWREKAVSRGGYRSQGGAWLPFDEAFDRYRNRPLEVQLVPMIVRDGTRTSGAPVTVRVPGRVEAWYEVARSGPPWRRELTVAVRADQPAQLGTLLVVLRRGGVMPLRATDGEVLRRVDDVQLSPEQPLRLRVSAPRGPYWLRCFAAADDSTDQVVELRDPPVVQLRGR